MQKNNRLILLLALAKFVLPYLLQHSVYEPHRDEFLYLAEGQHLAWGYLEVPPLLSLFAWLTTALGNSLFWIKFWPNLFGTLTFVLCARMISRLDGRQLAIWLLFFAFISTAWLRMFFLFQPNAPEIFFCTLMVYTIFRYLQTSRASWLYGFGIALGLGLLSKYTVAFWMVSLLAGILFSRSRALFYKNKHFYLSLILAFFVFLPNLLWQAVHNFPVLHHMAELQQVQLQYVSPSEFLLGELLMYLPVFFVWMAGLLYCFSFRGRHYRLFGIAFLLMQVCMLLFNGKSYYTAGSFTVLFVFGAVYLEQITIRKAVFVRYVMILFSLITGLFLWPLLLPVFKPARLAAFYKALNFEKTGALAWHDRKNHALPQDFADMLGWKEIANKTAKAWHRLPEAEKSNCMIWCGNYGQAGAINFYGPGLHIPQGNSDNGSFIFWNRQTEFPDNILLVDDNPDILDAPELKHFESVTVLDSVQNPYAVEYGTRIILLKNASEDFKKFFQQRQQEKLDLFRSKILE